jgi:amino acid transporter
VRELSATTSLGAAGPRRLLHAHAHRPVGCHVHRRPLLLSLIALLTYLSFRGLTVVGRTAVVLTAFTLLPFALFCVMAAPSFDPAPLQHVRPNEGAFPLHHHSQSCAAL